MYFFGLKLFSINRNYVEPALKLYEREVYHYIELYIVPGSFDEFRTLWKDMPVPFVIHAPHFKDGLNFAKKDNERVNFDMACEALKFADELKAAIVIFHPGVNGDIRETARQLNIINDGRIVIENKPYYGYGDNLICNGSSPEEILYLIEETQAGFCFDFGHAVCAANAKGLNQIEYMEKFLELKPRIYHLTDGDYFGLYDSHEHYGEGNFPIERMINLIPAGSHITNEAVKNSEDGLFDFEKDILFLKSLL
jgi:endonuclease IV